MDKMERARLGGVAAAARMTPDQRRARASKGYLASCVRATCARVADLTEEQREALQQALDSMRGAPSD